ncbi:hypothetical protein EIP91_007176 [Steccherinum ochraceum]|uniref:Endoplasmic reticulum junction formation protein lunapark n=1 Tax=Steccherinum ochraceum TaxID=92696 RepID=A0A4R0RQU2_9APHY|nr:hypothetical protein EIP91_007176 [Steccherinum ochraceum]
MAIFSGWFKRSNSEDYEQVLASLANDIQKRQTRLAEIHLRERRWTLLGTIYTLSVWAAYVSLWYVNWLPHVHWPRNPNLERSVKGIPVFVGPIIILFIRRIVQIWFTRKGNAEEKSLISLRKKQREKVEQIKKQTNYYTTRNLLERYDESSVVESPLRKRPVQGSPMQVPMTPQRPQGQQAPIGTLQTPQTISSNLQQQLSPSPQRPVPPPRKQWFDKLADAILGDDDTPAASRYALICEKCFAHNGLVKESVWEETQYVCMKCGHFNPSFKAHREARRKGATPERSSTSPQRNPGPVSPNGGLVGVQQPSQPDRKEKSRSPIRPGEQVESVRAGQVQQETTSPDSSVRMEVDS